MPGRTVLFKKRESGSYVRFLVLAGAVEPPPQAGHKGDNLRTLTIDTQVGGQEDGQGLTFGGGGLSLLCKPRIKQVLDRMAYGHKGRALFAGAAAAEGALRGLGAWAER